MQVTRESREALSRARFFLLKASQCPAEDRLEFEAFFEAAMVFARSALLRLEAKYKKHPKWKAWWDSLKTNPEVEFFRNERNWIVHQAPPRLGQKIFLGDSQAVQLAGQFYFFKDPSVLATASMATYLDSLNTLVMDAESRFS
jgi:hypothetical protein